MVRLVIVLFVVIVRWHVFSILSLLMGRKRRLIILVSNS